MSVCEWQLSVRGERRQPSFIRQLTKYLEIPGMVRLLETSLTCFLTFHLLSSTDEAYVSAFGR